ncbi:hypothetical protein [Kitasatospora purpeofusca]|uniref:hypothetical protein n=1 Tax=Kitasatospora purpeofusca TaxID=67352 RepID=UPI00380F1107
MSTPDKIATVSAVISGIALITAGFSIWYSSRQARANEAANVLATQANATADRALAVADRAALESQRARLDARAPQVTVTNGEVIWPPRLPPVTAGSSGSTIQPGHVFHTPQDDTLLVGLRASFEIKNGPVGVSVQVSGDLAPDTRRNLAVGPVLDTPQWLGPDGALKIFVEAYMPLSKWIESAKSPDGVEGVHYFNAWVGYADGFDTGIVDTVHIRVPARGLREDINRSGAWSFPADLVPFGEDHAVNAVWIGHRIREYWESKSDNTRLG